MERIMDKRIEKLISFINSSKTAFHTVEHIADELSGLGFCELSEADKWELCDGRGYFVRRSLSSLVAFVYRECAGGFNIIASHSDQPALRVKGSAERGGYVRLSTERYGGMLNYTWLDRALDISGRVAVRVAGGIEMRGVTLHDACVIPSVAIHLNRAANDGLKLDVKEELQALFGFTGSLEDALAKSLKVNKEDIISHELYLVSADEPRLIGDNKDIILSPRLDDLACVCASLEAFIKTKDTNKEKINVLAVFNNEEVGSETKQGAASTFLRDTLYRISGDEVGYLRRQAESFMLSADNAHAIHPNRPELSDAENAPTLSSGVVIKHNSNQRYTTDAESCAVFTELLSANNIPYAHYFNRADIVGGSTLGSISNTKVSVPSVDIGLPQLAMHSLIETASTGDYIAMLNAMEAFYRSSIVFDGKNIKLN
ncbi:MAG: M18 family aminopeptidase [Clostridia bacterium]|nr:M18 family aminopeptidase [Clostridia bacterium]